MSKTWFAYSRKAQRTQPQPVTSLLASALGRDDLISLAVGFVDDETLPTDAARQAFDKLLSDPTAGRSALQYGTTRGLPELRQRLVAHVAGLEGRSPDSLNLSAEHAVITTGSQQGLYILADVLIDPGDIVITSAPSYFVYTAALTSFGADVHAVPMDDGGMRIDQLERSLSDLATSGQIDRVKMIYVVTYYQNPTGVSLAVDRREAVVKLARQFSRSHRILVLEDAAYRELRYDGPETPSIKSFDPDNETVAMAVTFSKSLCPGMKTGCLLLPPDLVEPVVLQKGNHDFGSPNVLQHALAEFLQAGAYAAHVKRLQERYRQKRDTMLTGLQEELGRLPDVRWTEPAGGLYVWLTLPGSLDTGRDGRLFAECLDRGVLYVPGAYCFTARPGQAGPTNTLRLCYGLPSLDDIREGVRRLATAVHAEVKRIGTASPVRTRSTA